MCGGKEEYENENYKHVYMYANNNTSGTSVIGTTNQDLANIQFTVNQRFSLEQEKTGKSNIWNDDWSEM